MKHIHKRTGFTMVEILVVIAIIAILVALLLPAVQAVRAAARRLRCSNNMKQVTLGIRNYETKFQMLPPGNSFANPPGWQGWSALAKTLPYMEQGPIHDKIDFSVNAYSTQPPAPNVARNAEWTYIRINTFLCPSDVLTIGGEMVGNKLYGFPGCNYGVSRGPVLSQNSENVINPSINARFYGPFRGAAEAYSTSMAEIRDGESYTVALLEGLVSVNQSNAAPSVERNYVMGCTWPSSGGSPCINGQCTPLHDAVNFNSFIKDVQRDWAAQTDIRNDAGRFWHWGADHNTLMCTLLPPNSHIADARVGCLGCDYGEQVFMRNARSQHPSGANTAFVDGSVHFVSDDIDRTIWWHAGAIDDGEALDYDF